MLPSPSDLAYFLAVAEAGSLSKAAMRLGIAQPSLTLAMQRLETQLSVPLFLRSRKGTSLTKSGQNLLKDTRLLLQSWEKLREGVLNATYEVAGRLKLGVHPSVALYSLPLFLPIVLRDFPKLEISLTHDLSRNLVGKVIDLEIDLGIVVNPVAHPDLVIRPLARDEVTLWRSADIKNEDVLICEPSLLQTQAILRKLKRSGRKFPRMIESSSLEVIRHLAVSGAGWAILPERVARTGKGKLISQPGAPRFQDEIALIYRTEQRSLTTLKILTEVIQQGFAQSRR